MDKLELKIPPLLLVIIWGYFMAVIATFSLPLQFDFPYRFFSSLIVAFASIALPVIGAISFRRANTTVDPRYPERSAQLVTSGIYRYSRNPMYLGFSGTLLAWGLFLANPLAVASIALFILYMNRFQIQPEERAMREQFGEEYQRYTQTVRRWA